MLTNKLCTEEFCGPLDSWEELERFSENTTGWNTLVEPLRKRTRPRFYEGNHSNFSADPAIDFDDPNIPEIMVCHDYKGNYQNCSKFIDGNNQFEEFRFYHWGCIDIFCYFSHYFVTIPTLQYINCAHRNGVKIMGTLKIGDTGEDLFNNTILSSTESSVKFSAKLAKLCKIYNFDGWFLSIQANIITSKMPLLKLFLDSLTKFTHCEVPGSRVIWYDTIVESGYLAYQNELNAQNFNMLELCDGIFLNFFWRDQELARTDEFIRKNCLYRRKDVYFGIDVFGRNQLGKFRSHETLSKIWNYKFSTCLFAFGWTHESINDDLPAHMKGETNLTPEEVNEAFILRNDKFWNLLAKYLHSSGPASLPFYTNFSIGSGKARYSFGSKISDMPWFNLREQNFQISIPTEKGKITHYFESSLHSGSSLLIEKQNLIRLFTCDFKCTTSLLFVYASKRLAKDVDLEFHLKILDEVKNENSFVILGNQSENGSFWNLEDLSYENSLEILGNAAKNQINLFDPAKLSKNWNVRFFILRFEQGEDHKIIDIGVKKIGPGKILLGGLYIDAI